MRQDTIVTRDDRTMIMILGDNILHIFPTFLQVALGRAAKRELFPQDAHGNELDA